MFVQRAIVTLTLAPVGFALIYFGGWWFFSAITIILLIAGWELSSILSHHGWSVPKWLLLPAIALLLFDRQLGLGYSEAIMAVGFFMSMVYALWRYEQNQSKLATGDWFATTLAIVVVGWIGSHFILIRSLDPYGQWTMLVIVSIWGADTFAYLVGSQLGRRQFVPRLSPKKSIEGYIGGIVCTLIAIVGFRFILFADLPLGTSLWLGLFLTIIVPAGDLGMSLLKRETGVKDSGQIFPGHGGMLDRFDTVLWGVALAYYVITLWLV